MISSVDFSNIKDSPLYSYAKDLEFFQKNKMLELNEGLNIVFAPNGKGKSTLLKIMAQSLACEQGGISTITQSWQQSISHYDELKGISVIHDGQAAIYTNPRNSVGLVGGAFDDDFFDAGLQEAMNKQSTGLTTLGRMNRAVSIMIGKQEFPKKISEQTKPDNAVKELLKAKIKKGQKTLILDEPESGLALNIQANLWKIIDKAGEDFQIIVATHSPFALNCKANFIELQPGYINTSKQVIEDLAKSLSTTKKHKP